MIYLYLFGTCFHFIYVFMIIDKYMMKLVSEWNIPEIKKRGTNSNMLPDDPICAIKIVFIKGRHYIDCVFFKDFFIWEEMFGPE